MGQSSRVKLFTSSFQVFDQYRHQNVDHAFVDTMSSMISTVPVTYELS